MATATAQQLTQPATAEDAKVLYGVLAEFEDVGSLLKAAAKVREAGFTRWDCYSPFPIHGIEKVMGIPRTILPFIVAFMGLHGLVGGLVLSSYTMAMDPSYLTFLPTFVQPYNYVISGKPFLSLPAFIPVIFELTILFSALTAVFGMLGLNKLPDLYHPLMTSERFRRVTQDRFFIAIESDDPKFRGRKAMAALLTSFGASHVEDVED